MIDIKAKSGILSWVEDNIADVPHECGVFILRVSPTTDSIKLIESSEDLRNDLSNKIKDATLSEIKFFDWYSTNNPDDARRLASGWTEKYIS